MDGESKFGAGQVIAIGLTMAALLLWMDGWSHSVPVMVATAAVALLVFLGFRKSKPKRRLTHAEQIMLERESARRWLMSGQSSTPDDEPRERSGPKLTLIDGGKESPEE